MDSMLDNEDVDNERYTTGFPPNAPGYRSFQYTGCSDACIRHEEWSLTLAAQEV